jgi:hypothetical protein
MLSQPLRRITMTTYGDTIVVREYAGGHYEVEFEATPSDEELALAMEHSSKVRRPGKAQTAPPETKIIAGPDEATGPTSGTRGVRRASKE